MNDFSEKFENNYSSNFIKEIENTYLKGNASSSFFNNMKTNNNNRNNYIYFSMNNHNINKVQQNYFYFVEAETMNLLSQKSKDIQSQNSQTNNLKNENNKPSKKGSFDSSKENKNIKNINISGEQSNNAPKAFSNDKINKNIIDTLSEIKKFKTELCHSWELTGTCKYGQNVNI